MQIRSTANPILTIVTLLTLLLGSTRLPATPVAATASLVDTDAHSSSVSRLNLDDARLAKGDDATVAPEARSEDRITADNNDDGSPFNLTTHITTVNADTETAWAETFSYADGTVPDSIATYKIGGSLTELDVQHGKLEARIDTPWYGNYARIWWSPVGFSFSSDEAITLEYEGLEQTGYNAGNWYHRTQIVPNNASLADEWPYPRIAIENQGRASEDIFVQGVDSTGETTRLASYVYQPTDGLHTYRVELNHVGGTYQSGSIRFYRDGNLEFSDDDITEYLSDYRNTIRFYIRGDDPYGATNTWDDVTIATLGSTPNIGSVTGTTYKPHTVTGLWPCSAVTVYAGGGRTTISDDRGNYDLSLPSGTHDISFTKTGYHTQTFEDFLVEGGEAEALDVWMLSADCWGSDQVCFNELVNVIPYLGAPSELGGALNSLCVANHRIEENNDRLGALTVLLPALVDFVGVLYDVPDVIVDTFDGLIACVEDVAYTWVEALFGPEGAREFSRNLWKSMFPVGPLVVSIESHTSETAAVEPETTQIEPLELHIYSNGQHLGVLGGDIEHTIPSSYLFRMGNRYQIAIIKSATADYELRIEGNTSATYDMTVVRANTDATHAAAQAQPNAAGTLLSYQDLIATNGSRASLALSPDTVHYALQMDHDGDGHVDSYVFPDSTEQIQLASVYLPLAVRNY